MSITTTLVDFADLDGCRVTIALLPEGEVQGPDNLGGYAIENIHSIYPAVTQEDIGKARISEAHAAYMQDGCHHRRLYLSKNWRVTLIRQGEAPDGAKVEPDETTGHWPEDIGRPVDDGADHRSCTIWHPEGREARCIGYHCGNCDAPTGMMGGCRNCGSGS